MNIDADLISRLEELARLELQPAERERLRDDLEKMVQMIDKLQEVDVDGVEPLVYVNEQSTAPPRTDAVAHELTRADALRNAPQTDGEFFQTPKVIRKA